MTRKKEYKAITGDVNFNVALPADCTSETNCDYICNNFVDAFGAKDEASNLKSIEKTDLKKVTLTEKTKEGRKLAGTVSISYVSDGYDA